MWKKVGAWTSLVLIISSYSLFAVDDNADGKKAGTKNRELNVAGVLNHFSIRSKPDDLTTAEKKKITSDKEEELSGKNFSLVGTVEDVHLVKTDYLVKIRCENKSGKFLLSAKTTDMKAAKLKKGQKVSVSGTISKATWGELVGMSFGNYFNSYKILIESNDCEMK